MNSDRTLDAIGLIIAFGLLFGLGTLIFFGGNSPPVSTAGPPDANWSAERPNATHVQLAHTGGDAVQSDDLSLAIDDEERPVPWSGEVGQGDVGVIRAEENRTIELFWTAGGGDRVSLGRWTP